MHASDIAFDDVLLVMAAAVAVPLLLGLVPRLPIPSSVVEILAGIIIGPALLNWVHVLRRDLRREELVPSALLQATSLSFIVVAAQIGVTVDALRPINAASLVAAGMLSVLIFPAVALRLLDRGVPTDERHEDPDERAVEGM
jgi:xanthine/uracil permease